MITGKKERKIDYKKIDKIEIFYGLDFAGARHIVINDFAGKSHDYVINSKTGIALAFEILSKEIYPVDTDKWIEGMKYKKLEAKDGDSAFIKEVCNTIKETERKLKKDGEQSITRVKGKEYIEGVSFVGNKRTDFVIEKEPTAHLNFDLKGWGAGLELLNPPHLIISKADLEDDYERYEELLRFFLKGETKHLDIELEQWYREFIEHKEKYIDDK